MTGFGIYLVILYTLGILLNFYYAGKGGSYNGPGVLIFAAFWSLANVLGIVFLGTGTGIF